MYKMTDEQRYAAVLKELGEVLQSKNTTISCQQWQIDELKAKLADAEKEMADDAKNIAILTAECDMLKAQQETAEKELAAQKQCTEVRKAGEETILLLNNASVVALRAINAELRELYDAIAFDCGSVKKLEAMQEVLAAVLPVNGGAA